MSDEPRTPDRIAVDADGYGWRVWDDEDLWSMVPTNPDNSPIPHPVTWFVPAARSAPNVDVEEGRRLTANDRATLELMDEKLGEWEPMPPPSYLLSLAMELRKMVDRLASPPAEDGQREGLVDRYRDAAMACCLSVGDEEDMVRVAKLHLSKLCGCVFDASSDDLTRLREREQELTEALTEIATADPVDLALDPTWAQRIAWAVLSSRTGRTEGDGTGHVDLESDPQNPSFAAETCDPRPGES